ncbi:putative late blight resistance protein homolog R1A-3 [Henckelia pumila]|uniref:putative late blight resistance protein homolog R1A-3 n=1 Tax=Henckelia pumila TaxID=405737 RepID=UPI003C6DD529
MAYAAVISLKQTLQQILLRPYRYSIPCDKKHIESFHEKLEFLQHFLEEYPSHKTNEKVTSLERRIRDAAYEAQDFMDLQLKNILSDSKNLIPSVLIKAGKNVMNHIDAHLFVKLIKKVDSIIGEAMEIKEQMEIDRGRQGSILEEELKISESDYKGSSQVVSSNIMVGFDEYLMKIVDQLTGDSSALEVISIVGMGGIGKSTLATHAYNDPYVVHHFDVRAWVTVSQSYSVRDILLGMLDSMNLLTKEMYRESDDKLAVHVYQKLKGRRYMITIDDIWDTDAWDCLKMMFPDDEIGSRIMLTTRIADVAAYASPSGTPHQISVLSDDQSWKLLCAKVFGDEHCPLNLQEIGKAIAKDCGGLPLSIVVIGGLLSKTEKRQTAWELIAENVTSLVFSSDDRCSDILRLSYNYLPQYLKACFLYVGVFPKNYEIRVSKIIKLWIAEGFLRQAHGQSPEEVAEKCVENLFDRNLILMSKKSYEGKINTFRIHDILLDFCIKEAEDEKFLQITQHPTNVLLTTSASVRRISVHRMVELKHDRYHYRSLPSTSYVRSLVFLKKSSLSANLFSRFKRLRVLDATEVGFLEFPLQVLELVNLRYMALLCDGDIPASIRKLWNLQTLIISGYSLRSDKNNLPLEIWTMVHLRHVWFDRVHLFDYFDHYMTYLVLENLQTLSGLWNLRFTMDMLRRFPNIKKIDVSYSGLDLQEENGWSSYQIENVGYLHHLKALKISKTGPRENLMPPTLQFPPSLRTLTLVGVGIPWKDMAIIGSLPNLEVLKLKDDACHGTEWEPNEDEFLELKVLVLERLELKHWRADSSHFPSLQHLIIRWCDDLVEIPFGMGESPTLNTIELCKCNASVLASAIEILEKQRDYGNDGFQVIDGDINLQQYSKRGIIRAHQAIRKFQEVIGRRRGIRTGRLEQFKKHLEGRR